MMSVRMHGPGSQATPILAVKLLRYFSQHNQITGPLTRYYNYIQSPGVLRSESKNAFIKVLPKPGKDPLYLESYRPISLIDQDLKILSKIMADRSATFLPLLIGPSQVGFIKRRSAVCNIRKVLAVLDRVKNNPPLFGRPILLALNAEKAFDNVKWSWLDQVLDAMGISEHFRTFVKGIYANPTGQIFTQGVTSPSFPLCKGTRQGCPLSPLLFNIALEPLARFLEDSDTYQGIEVGARELKIALFADDVIIFMADPDKDLNKLLAEITAFGVFSGYKINISKSKALQLRPNIGRQYQNPNQANTSLAIKAVHDHITYLGIKIGRHSGELYSLNYSPLIEKICADLNCWALVGVG